MSDRPFHPLAEMWPLMGESALDALAASIRDDGQLVPIEVDRNGLVLDGRNRWLACRKAGVEPWVEVWDGPEEAVAAHIFALNERRRHLSAAQRGCLIASTVDAAEGWQKGRKRQSDQSDGNTVQEYTVLPHVTLQMAADMAGISRAYVSHGRQLWLNARDLWERVVSGEIAKIHTAIRECDDRRAVAGTKRPKGGRGAPSLAKPKGKRIGGGTSKGRRLEVVPVEHPRAPAAPEPAELVFHSLYHALNELSGIAQAEDPEALLARYPARLRPNLDLVLPSAARFLAALAAAHRERRPGSASVA